VERELMEEFEFSHGQGISLINRAQFFHGESLALQIVWLVLENAHLEVKRSNDGKFDPWQAEQKAPRI
jgi:hypothetical protein